jgi:hypothetical protein
VISDLKSILRCHLNLTKNRHEALAFGRFTGAARQTARDKELVHPSVL